MQFDQFDKKMKDAADHHHPAYDEKAWARMEKLLDKHLPNKEDDRRRFIFFLLFGLLVGGGIWLLVSKPWQSNSKIAVAKTAPVKDPAGEVAKTIQNNTDVSDRDKTPVTSGETGGQVYFDNGPETGDMPPVDLFKKPARSLIIESNQSSIASRKKAENQIADKQNDDKPVAVVKEEKPLFGKTTSGIDPVTVAQLPADKKEPAAKTIEPVSSTKEIIQEKPDEKEKPVIAKADEPVKNETSSKKKTNKDKKKNSLFFTLTTGPDLSFVGSGNSSKVKMLAGAGIGFAFKEKFTLRSGFYSGRQVYSAKPGDYNAPPQFYTYYPYLEKVDANCKVYEIPISLSYNFGKKSNWFVSAGISSLLMKEEAYKYYYKYTATGNTYTNNWTIKDKNSHYFSVGTLSAGYKHTIGKRVTVMAEPYVKIPFAGVGYGKVKLNSGGVLFTVGIKAF